MENKTNLVDFFYASPLKCFFSFQLLFQLIIDYLAEFSSTPAVFTMITEQLKKTYFNILIKPETLAKWVYRGSAFILKAWKYWPSQGLGVGEEA